MEYYRQGYNCSQCILKAAEDRYEIPLNRQWMNACAAVNNGFGVGSMCSVLVAGVMVFGLLFGKETAKKLRIKLLTTFYETHGSLNCNSIQAKYANKNGCEEIVGYIAELTEKIIAEEGIL